MAEFTGKLTVGSFEAFPNARLQPMPWSLRSVSPWGYFENNTLIAQTWTGLKTGNQATWQSKSSIGVPGIGGNIIKPLAGTIRLTAYDYQSRYPGAFVPLGTKIFIDNVLVAVTGDVGFAQFQMHAGEPHVIRVDMIDPYWGPGYIGSASTTQTVLLDQVIDISINVPRAQYEPWVYSITVDSKSGSGAFVPAQADFYVDGVHSGTTDVNGHGSVTANDGNQHSYIVSIADANAVPGEIYRVRAACTFGNSSVVATMVGTPPRFDFKSQLQYIYDFSISPTTRILDLVETGSFFNNEPILITPVYTGNIATVAYTITSSSGIDTHTTSLSPFTWSWTPTSTSTPDTVSIEAVFTDDTGASGSYSETFVVHSRHRHVITAVDASLSHPAPVPLVGADVYVDGTHVGVTDTLGSYVVVFSDANGHIVRVASSNPENPGQDIKYVDHVFVSAFDQISGFTYSLAWSVSNRPPVVTITSTAMGALNRPYVLEAQATDIDGTIAVVAFYVDNVFVGSKSTLPYVVSWTPLSTGSHSITAIATDNEGATGSASGTIVVSIAPVITSDVHSVIVVGTDNTVNIEVTSINGQPTTSIEFDSQVIAYSGPVQTHVNTYAYQVTLNSSVSSHTNLTVVATSTEGLTTTYSKPVYIASSYLPKVWITTKLAGPEYDVPIPVSADIYVDDHSVGVTDPVTGRLLVDLPDNNQHKITGHYVPLDLSAGTVFSGDYGTITTLQDFVFVQEIIQEITTAPVALVPKPYTGSVFVDPVFGDEKDAYLRILYGSSDTKGVTPGRFWDFRSLPLPYRPMNSTDFKVIIDDSGVGSLFRINILREHPTQVPTTDAFDFVAESTEHVISVYLGQGLNVFDVYAYDASTGGFSRLYSTSYVSTNYATVLYAYALVITKFLWRPLNQIKLDLFADSSTALVSPLIGFDDELPESQNLSRSARQRIVSGFINQPNSTASIVGFAGSLFQQTPLFSKTAFSDNLDINSTWMQALPTQSQTHNSIEMHIWNLDKNISRYQALPRYLLSTGDLLYHGDSHTVSTSNEEAVWSGVTSDYNPTAPAPETSWWEMSIDSEITYEMFPHQRPLSVVVYPGLWDSGEFPYFDQQVPWDSGKDWDSGDVSGDIVLDGFIGVPVTGELPWNQQPEVGVGVLDRCVELFEISNTYTTAFFEFGD